MVGRSKRSESEGSLSDRIALISSRRVVPVEAVPAPAPVPEVELSANAQPEDKLLAAKEQLIARLSAEVRPERRSLLSRGELAKVVDAATQAYMVRHAIDANPLDRRDLVTEIIDGLLSAGKSELAQDGVVSRRSNRAAIETAKAQIQPLVLEHMDVTAAADMPRPVFEAQLSGWVKDLLTETKIQLNFIEQRELVEILIADMLGLGPLEPLIEDETVTDIMVNGAKQVYVERRGRLELTDVRFRDDDHVMNVATKIVTRIGRRIDESQPLVQAHDDECSGVTIGRRRIGGQHRHANHGVERWTSSLRIQYVRGDFSILDAAFAKIP